jgi:hypothetical protein
MKPLSQRGSVKGNVIKYGHGNISGSLYQTPFMTGVYLDFAMGQLDIHKNVIEAASGALHMGSIFIHGGHDISAWENYIAGQLPEEPGIVQTKLYGTEVYPHNNTEWSNYCIDGNNVEQPQCLISK